MAQINRKNKKVQKTPENMSEFQDLLDSNKEKLSEGDYLALCNGMKAMFEKEEKKKEESMVLCKVRILTHEVHRDDGMYIISPIQRDEILNLSHLHFQKLSENLKAGNIVEYPYYKHESIIEIMEYPCSYNNHLDDDDSCDCGNSVKNPTMFKRTIRAPEYITFIYPKEEWTSRSDLARDGAHHRLYHDGIARFS